jgi:WD40 repeat protein
MWSNKQKGLLEMDYAAQSVAFSPDGELLMGGSSVSSGGGSSNASITLWDVQSLQQVAVLNDQMATIVASMFTPDGTHILSTSRDGIIRLWGLPR